MFESWGYARIITPAFECADVLELGLGADGRASAVRFVEPGSGEVVALRPDFTPQVARIAATRLSTADGPARFCYDGAVTRLGAHSGPKEILQVGIELIDVASPDGDAEALALAAASLTAPGLELSHGDAALDLRHVAPVRFVLRSVNDAAVAAQLSRALAKKDRASVAAIAAKQSPALQPLIAGLVELYGPAAVVLRRARALPWPREIMAAFDELDAIIAATRALTASSSGAAIVDALTIDLVESGGFEYYTGLHFAGYVVGAPAAVLRGGRYDELIGRYGRNARATGFAIDVEALAHANRAQPTQTRTIALYDVDRQRGARIATAMRAAGVRVAIGGLNVPPDDELHRHLRSAGYDGAIIVDAAGLDNERWFGDGAVVRAADFVKA